MSYYRVVGHSSQTSEPVEKVVLTAADAERWSIKFRRICGRHGAVEVWGKDGRQISAQVLDTLVYKEVLGASHIEQSECERLGEHGGLTESLASPSRRAAPIS